MHDNKSLELAINQHNELMILIRDVTTSLKALFVAPVMILYLAGVDLAFWLERISVTLWALMNVLAVGPFVAAGCLLILRAKSKPKDEKLHLGYE